MGQASETWKVIVSSAAGDAKRGLSDDVVALLGQRNRQADIGRWFMVYQAEGPECDYFHIILTTKCYASNFHVLSS